MAESFVPETHLPDDLLERIRGRAAAVDAENRFPDDDVAELAEAGYLRLLVPRSLGGGGLTLEQTARLQQRLATAAPATALAVNMHLVWTAVAKILADRGIDDLTFVLEGAAAGEVYAFGISEAGNDLVLFGSDTEAEPLPDGGYAFTGTKIFTSLAPIWTQLGLHGLDESDPDDPKLVYAFVPRSPSVVTRDDWDTLGMRGSQSRTTELHGAEAPAERVARVVTPGPSPDPIVFGIFAAFELLVSSVYAGIAGRALDLAVEQARARRSKRTGLSHAQDPDVRRRVGGMGIAYDALPPQIAQLARDVDELADHGAHWFTKLSGLKHRVTTGAKHIVDEAMLVGGGASFRTGSELARLYRDVVAGAFHPSNADSAHSAAATAWLGPVE